MTSRTGSAIDRLRTVLAIGLVSRPRAAAALGVPEYELWEWLFGSRWSPTGATCAEIHALADALEHPRLTLLD